MSGSTNRKHAREYSRAYRLAHLTEVQAYMREYRKKHKQRLGEQRRKYYQSDRGRDRRLWQLYRITLADWNVLFERQGRACACCRARTPGRKYRRWCTDHDHSTKKVRGILCHRCNSELGKLGDTAHRIIYRVGQFLKYLGVSEWPVAA